MRAARSRPRSWPTEVTEPHSVRACSSVARWPYKIEPAAVAGRTRDCPAGLLSSLLPSASLTPTRRSEVHESGQFKFATGMIGRRHRHRRTWDIASTRVPTQPESAIICAAWPRCWLASAVCFETCWPLAPHCTIHAQHWQALGSVAAARIIYLDDSLGCLTCPASIIAGISTASHGPRPKHSA